MSPHHPTLTPISTSSSSTMKRAPSPPNTNHHCSFSPSPLSSPSLLPSPTSSSSSSSYFSPSYHQPITFSSNDDRPPAPERRRSSGGFPRSQPLRPMLGLTSLAAGGATAPSEKPQLIPINGMKAGPGKGKVKMLVGRTMKSTFELNLNCRELSRAE